MIVVTGGVHGDEPSGAQVLPQLSREGFRTFGPCNPWGLAQETRTLADGRDLNRVFAARDCPEASRVRRFLHRRPPSLLLDLHEDNEVDRAYLIQVAPGIDYGQRILERLQGRYPLHPRPRFEPFVGGRDGLIRPAAWMLWCQYVSRRWSLTFYAWQQYGCPAFVVEAPSGWPLQQRLAFHRDVCLAAAALLPRYLQRPRTRKKRRSTRLVAALSHRSA